MTRGVYFLANDRVYDLAVAFLNSFRSHNKDLPLCLLPFNEQSSAITALAGDYDFSVFNDAETLAACDAISRRFHGFTVGAYRKLSMWEGPFEEFMYIDLDMVVLDDVGFAFKGLEYCDVLTSHSHMPETLQWVWKDGIHTAGVLDAEQIAYAANTGFIVSTRRFMNLDAIRRRLDGALAVREHMTLGCMEQPLLNYLFVTSGKRYSSLSRLHATGVCTDLKFEAWAGTKGGVVKGGRIEFPGVPRFLVHWAGFSKPEDFPYWDLWLYYRNLNKKLPAMDQARASETRQVPGISF